MLTSIDAEQSVCQNSTLIYNLKKHSEKIGIEGNFLNLIKNIVLLPTGSIFFNDETLNTFPLSSGSKARVFIVDAPTQHRTGSPGSRQ